MRLQFQDSELDPGSFTLLTPEPVKMIENKTSNIFVKRFVDLNFLLVIHDSSTAQYLFNRVRMDICWIMNGFQSQG